MYSNQSLSNNITNFIERFYNELHKFDNRISKQKEFYFEIYDFLIMEMFISATAFCLHFEKYSELHEILNHTFFLEDNNSIKDYNYSTFRKYFPNMEDVLNANRDSKLITAVGDLLVEREVKPILTRQTISNADIVLCQLYPIFDLKSKGNYYWFPTTYIYNDNNQIIWKKMKSIKQCNKVKLLFGVSTIDELKECVKKSTPEKSGYQRSLKDIPSILNSIDIEDIATTN